MEDDAPAHRSWLTFWLPVVLGVLAVLAYVVVVSLEIGSMRADIRLNAARVDKLEQLGSGPVQQSAERVSQIQSRVDRILSELLDMQKRVSDIATAQARDGEKLEQLRRGQ